jgi:hypothetical protein
VNGQARQDEVVTGSPAAERLGGPRETCKRAQVSCSTFPQPASEGEQLQDGSSSLVMACEGGGGRRAAGKRRRLRSHTRLSAIYPSRSVPSRAQCRRLVAVLAQATPAALPTLKTLDKECFQVFETDCRKIPQRMKFFSKREKTLLGGQLRQRRRPLRRRRGAEAAAMPAVVATLLVASRAGSE